MKKLETALPLSCRWNTSSIEESKKQMQLEDPDVSDEKKEAVRDRFKGQRDVIFASQTDDLYGKEFHDQVEKIAAKLRGHLRR